MNILFRVFISFTLIAFSFLAWSATLDPVKACHKLPDGTSSCDIHFNIDYHHMKHVSLCEVNGTVIHAKHHDHHAAIGGIKDANDCAKAAEKSMTRFCRELEEAFGGAFYSAYEATWSFQLPQYIDPKVAKKHRLPKGMTFWFVEESTKRFKGTCGRLAKNK